MTSPNVPSLRCIRDKERVRDLLQRIDQNLERYFLVALYFYIFVIVAINVLFRFLLNYTPVWGADTAVYMYIFLTWIGAAWNIRKRRHVRIDLIQKLLPERGVGLSYILNDLATLAFVYFVLVGFMPIWQNTVQLGADVPSLGLSQIYFLLAIPIGFALITLRALQMLYWDFKAVKNGSKVYRGERIIGQEDGRD